MQTKFSDRASQPFTLQKQIIGLVAWLAVAFATSAIGAVASITASSFYAELNQPSWAPPSSVFGPVWTFLYALMGVSAWLVWRNGGVRAHRAALALFVVQLAVNALWSWLFFGWHLGAAAMVDIVVLWILIASTIALFWRARLLAGVLMLPYLGWVSFAAALNYSVWQLNPTLLADQTRSRNSFLAELFNARLTSFFDPALALAPFPFVTCYAQH